VEATLARLGVRSANEVIDLGGTMSLNLHIAKLGLVLRIHPSFVTRERLLALQAVRAHVAHCALVVPALVEIDGSPLIRIDQRFAELEHFVAHTAPPPTWESYIWMFESAGYLHQTLRDYSLPVPAPLVATYGYPSLLHDEAARTAAVVHGDARAVLIAAEVVQLIEDLGELWIEASALPQHIVHGDVRLGNVARTLGGEPAFFDFGFAARRPRVHELAYALSWIVLRPDDSGRADDFPWDRVPQLIAAYEHGCQDGLLLIERRALAPYLAAVPLYLAAVSSHTPDPATHLHGELPFIRIARWIIRNAREITRHIDAD